MKQVLTILGLVSSAASMMAQGQKPLNIVYIMSDDHSYQFVSAYDKRYVSTPNIDALAKHGVRFTESFVANSLSGPSRACMLTGKHSHMNGKTNNEHAHQFNQDQQTMPKILRANGYQTALIGKLHLEGIPQGFDYWNMLPGQGEYYNPLFITPNNKGGIDTVQHRGYVTNIVTDMSIDWLEHRDKTKPFALFVHHKAAHRIWMPDTVDVNKYEDKTFPLPKTFYDDYKGRIAAEDAEMRINRDMDLVYDLKMQKNAPKISGLGRWYTQGIYKSLRPEEQAVMDKLYNPLAEDLYKRNLQGKELAEWKYQRYMRDYAKVITSLDRNIGRLMEYLKEHDLLDNTLIVYTSDQGFYMGENGWFDKRFMYDISMRTPLVMRLPKGLDKRGDVTQMVQNIDYAPTFLDLAGIKVPQDMQGVSLLPLLKNNKPVKNWNRNSLYYHFYEFPGEHNVRRHYGIRTKNYKLIHFYGKDTKGENKDFWEMYDLRKDPEELNNIYNKPSYSKVQAGLHKGLDSLRHYYKAENAY